MKYLTVIIHIKPNSLNKKVVWELTYYYLKKQKKTLGEEI